MQRVLNGSIKSPGDLGMKMDHFAGFPLAELGVGDITEAFVPDARITNTVSRGRILAKQIDSGALLRASHHLRYQAYCVDRKFLRVEDYPDQLERDDYDAISTHFGVFVDEVSPERMIGTARLVPGDCQFPLHDHCTIAPRYQEYFRSGLRTAEISRLMVSPNGIAKFIGRESHALRKDILVALYKAMYRWVEAQDVSLLFAAMEEPLARLLRKTGFPFVEIGPEADYYGRVFPYVLDIEFAKLHLRMHAPDIWSFFLDEQVYKGSQPSARWMRPLARVG
jgi:N-acyl-L-homoserine lactone synthetase